MNAARDYQAELELASDAFLAVAYWGARGDGPWKTYHAPLPPTDQFPRASRPGGSLGSILFPPYIAAHDFTDSDTDDFVRVMLCDPSGVRANTAGVRDMSRIDDVDVAAFICVGRENVPDVWREPIGVALAEIRQHWPDKKLHFEPDSIPQPKE